MHEEQGPPLRVRVVALRLSYGSTSTHHNDHADAFHAVVNLVLCPVFVSGPITALATCGGARQAQGGSARTQQVREPPCVDIEPASTVNLGYEA